MSLRHKFLMLSVWTVVAGCSEPGSPWSGTMQDSAGVVIVSNTETGIWAPGEEWALVEELRIGEAEGSPEYQFGRIGGVTVDLQGSVYVLDVMAQDVKVYSDDGRYLQTVAGPGPGPTELRGAVTLLMGPGDTLLIQDNRALRMKWFATDGSGAGGYPFPLEERHPQAFKTTDTGVIAEQFHFPDAPGQSTAAPRIEAIVRETTGGRVLDTLLTYPSMEARGALHYGPTMTWDLGSDVDLYCGLNTAYRIEVYADGRLKRVITKPHQLTPISDEQKDAVLARIEQGAREAGAPAQWVARMRASTHVADVVPAFQKLAVGPRGTLWVQMVLNPSELLNEEHPDFNEPGSPEWEVFDSTGRFLGVVTMPERFTFTEFRGGKLYGIIRDDMDVEYVVRYGVSGASGA